MKLTDVRPAKGAVHRRKRVGTGPGSGHGGTCCRGHKGTGARSGGGTSRHFEGGQLPIHRRLPKGGFTPRNRTVYQVVNVKLKYSLITPSTVTPVQITNVISQPSRVASAMATDVSTSMI